MPTIYSHSRLASFEDCPRKFRFRYVLKIPRDGESIEGFVGKRVHEVLERLYLARGRGHLPTLPQVLHRYRVLFDEHFDPERVRIVRTDTPVAEYRANGERSLTHYYRRNYPFDADETLALEERVRFDLDESGQYRMQGYVDRISRARDGAIEIHDYKTSRWVPTQQQLDEDRQLALYQIGVTEKFGNDGPVRLVWHYVFRDQVRTSSRTPEQLAALRERTVALIDRIHGETEFETRPSNLCQWCEYNDICPAIVGEEAAARALEAAAGREQTAPEGASDPEAPQRREQLSLL